MDSYSDAAEWRVYNMQSNNATRSSLPQPQYD